MKTDEEMIKSLFKRRDEYYKSMEKSVLSRKNSKKAAVRLMVGITVPIAAAAAVALTLIAAQKNIIENNICLTDVSGSAPDTDTASYGEASISSEELLTLYKSDRSKLADDFKALDFTTIPMCVSYNGTIYKSDYYMTSAAYTDYVPAAAAEECSYTIAGTARVLETDFPDSNKECTVFDVVGKPEYKAVVVNGVIELYREMGECVRTVQGVEFEIQALHRTANAYRATMLPILREGEDIIYRAYDLSGDPIKDTFILYTPDLTGSNNEYAVWEVKGEIPDELLGEYPELKLITVEQLVDLFEEANNGELSPGLCSRFSGVITENGCQIYCTDELGVEYAAEFYDGSDKAALVMLATNQSLYLKNGAIYLDNFLSMAETVLPETNNYIIESMTLSYEEFKAFAELLNGNGLYRKDIIGAGGYEWDNDHDRYDFFFPGNDTDYTVTAVIGEDDRVRYFIVIARLTGEVRVIDTFNDFYAMFGDYPKDSRTFITYSDVLLLAEKAREGTLTAEIAESMGAENMGNGTYAYELYYDLYSQVYFKIELTAESENEIFSAVITDTETGKSMDMTDDAVVNFIREREDDAYLRYLNSPAYIDYSGLKKLADMADNKTLTLKYAESLGAKHTYDGSEDCVLYYQGEYFLFRIYISADSEGVKSVRLTNTQFDDSDDEGIDLMTDCDKLMGYLNRYTID